MNDVLHMLLGALLVCLGILTAALADRLRQLRGTRRNNPSIMSLDNTGAVIRESQRSARKPATPARAPGSEDVIAALQGAGYKKAVATQAVLACTEREQLTPESWMEAALRRCA